MRTLLLSLLLGCDDTIFGKPVDSGGGPGGGDDTAASVGNWCGVQAIFEASCLTCHGSGGLGGLDLETDAYTALVGVTSSQYSDATLVIAGDAAGSLLYQKVTSTQSADHGDPMPLGASLPAEQQAAIELWIDAGATQDCSGGSDTGVTPVTYHPDGFDDPEVHGLEAKLQDQTCVTCHGEDLAGGSVGVSCDSCHEDGWRTNCTFCHGGTVDSTGAPPRDIDGTTDTDGLTFWPHTTHVTDTDYKNAFDCTACHSKPEDVLSTGHLFLGDSTPAVAEVDFSGGLSSRGAYNGAGTCSNLYCHGDGQGHNGTASVDRDYSACSSCHPDRSSGEDDWKDMSGEHEEHIGEGLSCSNCHGATVSGWDTIIDPSNHVNGQPDIELPSGMTWSSGDQTCTGTCHSEEHRSRDWD